MAGFFWFVFFSNSHRNSLILKLMLTVREGKSDEGEKVDK